jgi:hypothetical protein
MLPTSSVDGDNPFQAVAGRGTEHQFGLEVFVMEQLFLQRRYICHMVEVDTQQFRVLQKSILAPSTEDARESAEVEVLCLVLSGGIFVGKGS